jgi:hypothetical protein
VEDLDDPFEFFEDLDDLALSPRFFELFEEGGERGREGDERSPPFGLIEGVLVELDDEGSLIRIGFVEVY